MRSERVSWIDICRGIGIILVLYGHGLAGDSYRYIIYSFHMPLFFFLSGVVFHHKKYDQFLPMIKKSVRGILYPYFLFAFLTYSVSFLSAANPWTKNALWQLFGIVYGNGTNGLLAFNVVLWFLPCLFLTKVGFAVITKYVNKKRLLIVLLFLFSLAGYFFSLFFPKIKLPYGMETAFTAIVFFGAGYLWNTRTEKHDAFFRKHLWTIFVASALLCVTFAVAQFDLFGRQIDMRANRLNNYFLFYLAAFSGIFMSVGASVLVHKQTILEYLGKHSMVLFIWHLIVFAYISRFLRMFITAETINDLRNLYLAPLYTVVSIGVILAFSILIKKLRPLLLSSMQSDK